MGKISPPAISGGKHIKAAALQAEGPDPEKLPPKFSFRHLNGNFCISKCTDDEKVAFVDRMRRLSELTWSQLRQQPRHKLGYETIDRHSIRAGIPATITADVTFIAFRFYKLAPMVGYRAADGTFYVVWFDREFKLYNHG